MPLLTAPDHAPSNRTSFSSSSWSDGEAIIPPRRNDVRDYQIDGEAVLFDPKTNQLYYFNQAALTAWQLCDGRTTFRQVVEMMSGKHDISFETALDRVEELVAALSAMNLLDHDVA